MRAPLLLVVLAFLLTACGGNPGTEPTPTPAAPATTASPVPPKPAPKVGSCHELTFTAATRAVDDEPAVGCQQQHSSVTFETGPLDLVVDGHLVAMDSQAVSDQLDGTCARGLSRWLGGSADDLRLSRFRDVWFRPDVQQADRGASWYRCDIVAVAREGQLARFTGDLRGALDADDALDRWGICGTSSPVRKRFERVICSESHTWRAVSIVDLPDQTKYLGKKAARMADTACRDEATSRVNESLKYEWAFQWPTREEWESGQRYGWCWIPA